MDLKVMWGEELTDISGLQKANFCLDLTRPCGWSHHQLPSLKGGRVRVMLMGYTELALTLLVAFIENQDLCSNYIEIDTRHSGIRVKIVALLLAYKPIPATWSLPWFAVSCPEQQWWSDGSFYLNLQVVPLLITRELVLPSCINTRHGPYVWW